MVMPTPPMMCSLESNTSSMASGQLCNKQAWFFQLSLRCTVLKMTCGMAHVRDSLSSTQASVNHVAIVTLQEGWGNSSAKGSLINLWATSDHHYVSDSNCPSSHKAEACLTTVTSFGWSCIEILLFHYESLDRSALLCWHPIYRYIQGSYTFVMSTSSGSPWGHVSLAVSITVPVGPQQFSCKHRKSYI